MLNRTSRHVLGRIVTVALLVAAVLVTVAPAAHALTACGTGCPTVANEDDYTVAYTSTGVTLHETAATGVLANDSGPSTTIVDLQDTPDSPGTHALTTLNGFDVTINNDGSFTYKADNTFSGIDSFDYYIWDSKNHDNSDFNTVYITITATVHPDTYSVNANTTLNVSENAGVTANDLGVDPTTLTLDGASAHGGTINDDGNGAFDYTPAANFVGTDTFGYDVSDLDFDNDYQGAVTITVLPAGVTVPDPPMSLVASAGNASVSVAFAPPPSDGGATITGYSVTCTSTDGGTPGNASGSTSPIVVDALTNGSSYACTATASNTAGPSSASAASNTVPLPIPDTTPPSVSASAPSTAVTLGLSTTVRWSATDASGIGHYDVQVENAPWNGGFSVWTNWKMNTTATSATYTMGYGRMYCFRVRAADTHGNVSGWTQKCTSVPLRATSMSAPGWTKVASTAYFGAGAISTKTKAVKATLTGAQTKRIWLVVTKCGTCGTIQVLWNNVVKATFSLHSSTTLHKQIMFVGALPAVQSGTLTIKTTTSGQPVVIEAVTFGRT